jgi:hypothetical protein
LFKAAFRLSDCGCRLIVLFETDAADDGSGLSDFGG